MTLPTVTVHISYRFDAGHSDPKWKALRARIVQQNSAGPVYGSDLIPPNSRDVDYTVSRALLALHGTAHEVVFTFDAKLNQPAARRFVGGVLCELRS